MGTVCCIDGNQRRSNLQAAETKTTFQKSINTERDEVWAKATIHGEGLKRIAREIGRTYTETEDLLIEAALAYGDKMFRHGVRLGRTMPRIPVRVVAA